MHFQHAGIDRHARDRCDIAEEVEAEFVVEGSIDRVRGTDCEERIAVGWGAHDRFGRDVGAAARPVLDDERLAEPLRKPLTDQSSKNVLSATGRIAYDDPYRP